MRPGARESTSDNVSSGVNVFPDSRVPPPGGSSGASVWDAARAERGNGGARAATMAMKDHGPARSRCTIINKRRQKTRLPKYWTMRWPGRCDASQLEENKNGHRPSPREYSVMDLLLKIFSGMTRVFHAILQGHHGHYIDFFLEPMQTAARW